MKSKFPVTPTKTINAAGASASFTYDKSGNVLTSTDYAGITTTNTYDSLDRLIKTAACGEETAYTYTANGLLKTVTDKSGTTFFAYDEMNGLSDKTLPDGTIIHYDYDKSCRLTKIATPFGTTGYEYDGIDRLVRVVARDGLAALYSYDENGNRTAVQYTNGTAARYEYDALNRLVKEEILDKDGHVVAQYTYTLGASGERLKVEELDRIVEYSYDSLNRLTKEAVTKDSDSTVTEYTYDANSNRLTKTENGVVTSYTYNCLNQLVKENDISMRMMQTAIRFPRPERKSRCTPMTSTTVWFAQRFNPATRSLSRNTPTIMRATGPQKPPKAKKSTICLIQTAA